MSFQETSNDKENIFRSEPIVMDTDAKPEPAAPQKSTSGKSKAPPKWFKMNWQSFVCS